MRIDFFAQKPRKRKKRKKNSKKDLQNRKNRVIITKSYRWPLSQTVKTSPSHGEDMGSIPVGVTNCKYPEDLCPKVLAFYMQEAFSNAYAVERLSIGIAPRRRCFLLSEKKCGLCGILRGLLFSFL